MFFRICSRTIRSARPELRAADVVEDALKYLQQERAGAAGEIEHGDALVIGQAVADAEASPSRISSTARTMKFTIGGGV